MFEKNQELIAYDVALLKSGDVWKPFLPARYAYRDLGIEKQTDPEAQSNADIAMKIAEAFGCGGSADGVWWDFAGYYDQEWVLTHFFPPNNVKFSVTGDLTLRRHLLGEFACVAPISPFGDPGTLPGHAVVSGRTSREGVRHWSDRVRVTLDQLTHVLRGRDNQIIWIMGEPGSGKEVFAQALHYGSLSGRTRSRLPNDATAIADFLKKDTAFRAISVAGIGIDEFNERLYTAGPDKTTAPATKNPILRWFLARFTGGTTRGGTTRIEDAEGGGTIFLDEFDKPSNPAAIYDSLLRVLEARQYIKREVKNNQTTATPETYKEVNWIFAGAFTKKDLKDAPPDLWSRLTGVLKTHNFVEEKDYAISLFLYFYLRSVIDIYSSKKDVDGILKILGSDENEIASVVKVLLGMERSKKMISPEPFSPKTPLLHLADEFSKSLSQKGVARGMVV